MPQNTLQTRKKFHSSKRNNHKYKEAVLEIYDNLEKYSSRARQQAETKLDIDIVSKKYINVIKKYC